jgi:hypothetical protein
MKDLKMDVNNSRVYFMPGDVVMLKQDIPNKPKMIVDKKETLTLRPSDEDEKSNFLKGIKCFWFTEDGHF